MLQNAYFLAKFVADTAENEQHFAENWQKFAEIWRSCRRSRGHVGGRGPAAERVGEDAVQRGLRVPAAGRVLGRRVPPAGEPAPL